MRLAMEKKVEAVVTAPINKAGLKKAGFDIPGHTEYLAEKFSVQNFLMLLVSDALRVGVVTGHIPINQVAQNINLDKIVSKARTMNASLKQDFGIASPRLVVAGLTKDNLTFTDDAFQQIIQRYTREAGVRNLEREISSICRKIATTPAYERGLPRSWLTPLVQSRWSFRCG